MRNILLTAVAAAAIATPAVARDGQTYVGAEGGILLAKDTNADIFVDFNEGTDTDFDSGIDYKKPGLDLDLILGHDFGLIRAEAELGYKRARHDEYGIFDTGDGEIGDFDEDGAGNTNVVSLMANVLLDFGNNDGASFYVGGGAGWARVKYNFDDADEVGFDDLKGKGLAWQLIAGARYAITPQLDLGLKYRYFRGPDADGDIDLGGVEGLDALEFDAGRFKSHSLLASLIFNFGEAAVPPPPPPPPLPPAPLPPAPPATQTCPDGSVILATDSCPLPPPPPPPPLPAPERG